MERPSDTHAKRLHRGNDRETESGLTLFLCQTVETIPERDVLTIYGSIAPGVDVKVRMAIEGLQNRRKTLLVLLHTGGGIIEEVRNIVQVIRHHYKYVHFLVPVYAMSAGTVLTMSGDKIYMDYFSRLGPIDPQIQINSGERLVSDLSYLRQFENLIKNLDRRDLRHPSLLCLTNWT